MSRAFQERFLNEQIREYEQLLRDGAGRNATRAHRNLIKVIEKQKAAREERLKDLLAGDKKDDGLVFDELGADHLFVDEAHFFNEACSVCSYVGRGLRPSTTLPGPDAWESAAAWSSTVPLRRRIRSRGRQPTRQGRVVPVPWATGQLAQPFQVRRVRPAGV